MQHSSAVLQGSRLPASCGPASSKSSVVLSLQQVPGGKRELKDDPGGLLGFVLFVGYSRLESVLPHP